MLHVLYLETKTATISHPQEIATVEKIAKDCETSLLGNVQNAPKHYLKGPTKSLQCHTKERPARCVDTNLPVTFHAYFMANELFTWSVSRAFAEK